MARRVTAPPLHEGVDTPGTLGHEAALTKREDFEQFLKLISDVPAQAGDELSSAIDTSVKTRNRKP